MTQVSKFFLYFNIITSYLLSCKHPLCSSKKRTGDGSEWTVRKLHINYTNIVIVNEMFACVYAALELDSQNANLVNWMWSRFHHMKRKASSEFGPQLVELQVMAMNWGGSFEYTYKWWRGNCENSPLPTIGSPFQCVKVDLPSCIDVCTCAYILKWYSVHIFFLFLLKNINISTFAHWNYCSALPMVEPPRCSERYTNCLSIIYMYTQREIPCKGWHATRTVWKYC